MRKKRKKNSHAQKMLGRGFEPGISNSTSGTLTTQPPSSHWILKLSSCLIYIKDTIFCAILAYASTHALKVRNFLRNCAYCAKVGANVQNCALKNHYSAPHIKGFRRLGSISYYLPLLPKKETWLMQKTFPRHFPPSSPHGQTDKRIRSRTHTTYGTSV